LPYWYFPWVAWFFIPLALLPFNVAKVIYLCLTLLSVFFVVFVSGQRYSGNLPLATKVFLTAMGLLSCWLLFRVGQVDFIILAIATAMVLLIDQERSLTAGVLFPVLLVKPHLLTVFMVFAVLRGGRKFALSASMSVLFLSLIAFILLPDWPLEMLRMLSQGGQRTDNSWGFTTFAALLGRQENWSGTGNPVITLLVALIAFFATWKNRHLPTVPFLAFAMLASMLCAPRAYSYNFPFLLPALLWLSSYGTVPATLLWLTVGALSLGTRFSTGAYLVVLLTFVLAILRARSMKRDLAGSGVGSS